MKSIFVLILLCLCSSLLSQKKVFDLQKKYAVDECLKDIDYTEKYLCKFHPDPFRYISKDSLHQFVKSIKTNLHGPLTEMQLRFYIKQIIAKIGCGHTDAAASKKYTKQIQKTSRAILPINAFVVDSNRLFVLNNLSTDTTIRSGDEIININHSSVPTILRTIFSIYSSDGLNTTYKKQGIKYNWFKYYYSFCYGYQANYVLDVKNAQGIISSHTLQCISSLKDTLILPTKTTVESIHETKFCHFYLLNDNNNIAIMDIDGFKGRGWRKFTKRSFTTLKERNIKNLVIDLRDNGGGEIMDGLNLLSYLNSQITVLPFDRKPNLLPFNFRYKMGPFTRFSPILFSTLLPQRFKNGRLQHYFFSFSKKNNYNGNVFVLINGKSFSMSGVVASYLKYNLNAKLIGEETGGNVKGSNAVLSGKIILPNSKIQVYIPYYHIYHRIPSINTSRGVMPDHPTHYESHDVINGIDLDLKKVLELVN